MPVQVIQPLERAHLAEAAALLSRALPHDRIAVVAEEKLFGDNGARTGVALGAFEGDALVGVIAAAGRWIKLLAVDEAHRRRGIGTALLERVRVPKLRLMDHPGNYLSPGIDARYARGFFERYGFRTVGEVENIRAPLDNNPLVERELSPQGYELRRASSDGDDHALFDWIARAFAPVWAHEVRRALAGPRGAVHVALSDGAPVAFAAADGNNQGLGWFGPAGTDPAHRGKRLGEALLLRCLRDVRGLPDAGVIAWIGPKDFYRKTCGAVEDRRFVLMECER
jgi:GNAT superfamily N-acetyltransferase